MLCRRLNGLVDLQTVGADRISHTFEEETMGEMDRCLIKQCVGVLW